MSKINFEEDVANIDQTGLESVAELLREQLRLESVIENTEEQLKGYKEHLRKSSACYEWLEDNGLGDIIKNNVGISFGKGEGNKAKHLEETIKEMGLIPEVKISVHPSTLKATIKKWHQEGRSVPDNTFSLFIGQKTKITKKK